MTSPRRQESNPKVGIPSAQTGPTSKGRLNSNGNCLDNRSWLAIRCPLLPLEAAWLDVSLKCLAPLSPSLNQRLLSL
eukprot:1202673-Amphidinium_carterae.1